jgi:predicted nucleic acid-binding protein
VLHRLAALRVETRLRLHDCCVLLAAQDADGTVLTFDDRLEREATRLGLIA